MPRYRGYDRLAMLASVRQMVRQADAAEAMQAREAAEADCAIADRALHDAISVWQMALARPAFLPEITTGLADRVIEEASTAEQRRADVDLTCQRERDADLAHRLAISQTKLAEHLAKSERRLIRHARAERELVAFSDRALARKVDQ